MRPWTRAVLPLLGGIFSLSSAALAAPCIQVTLTGTGGPPAFNGLAGPGTLVGYGDDATGCRDVLMQFDAGRGTVMRLSQVGVQSTDLAAVFLTHIHSDHLEGLSDIVQQRWMYGAGGPKLDIVCASDAVAPAGYTVSCRKLIEHIDDAYKLSGETAVRIEEMPGLDPAGAVDMLDLTTFDPPADPQRVWSLGDVTVSAIASAHIPGHASFRVDTPAGSVVISGDAASEKTQGSENRSTSGQVEKLAKGADILVQAAIHPALAPSEGSGMPAPIYLRQSDAIDVGAMAQRDGIPFVMLTHLGPALGAESQGPWPVPGGSLNEADYREAVEAGGYTGTVIVGTDLATLRLPLAK